MNRNTQHRTIVEAILARHDVVICSSGISSPITDEEHFIQLNESTYRTRNKKSLAEINCLVKRLRDAYTDNTNDNTKIELIYADNDTLETISVVPV